MGTGTLRKAVYRQIESNEDDFFYNLNTGFYKEKNKGYLGNIYNHNSVGDIAPGKPQIMQLENSSNSEVKGNSSNIKIKENDKN